MGGTQYRPFFKKIYVLVVYFLLRLFKLVGFVITFIPWAKRVGIGMNAPAEQMVEDSLANENSDVDEVEQDQEITTDQPLR